MMSMTRPNRAFSRKRETMLGFALRLSERISRREKVRDQVVAAVGRKSEVADPVRGIERATHQIAARPDMSRPRHDEIAEVHIGPGLEALQSTLLDQLIAELAEAKSGLIVAEVRSGDHAKP